MNVDSSNLPFGSVDVSNCDREPIHVPGSIQPFGVLLALRAGETRVAQVTNNTDSILGMEPLDVLGRELTDVLGQAFAAEIASVFADGKWKETNPLKLTIDRQGYSTLVNAILHRYDGLDFIELEAVSPESSTLASRSFHVVQGALLRLQQSLEIPDLWTATVAEVQKITGYDRVMVYKFDRDNHGSVIAEQKRDHLVSFLGLHYPASDIPEQARRLYCMNWIRYIPDVHYQPVDLIPVVDDGHKRFTDMTHCVLRSVSPIHCTYLHNMGVAASMSVSIIRDGRLWGLIACHNETPRYLPFELRAAFELLGQVLSIRIAALEDTADCVYKSKTNDLQARFLAELPQFRNVASALVSQSPNLLDFIPCSGAAVCVGNDIHTLGRTPSPNEIKTILRGTLNRITAPVFVTDRLQERIHEAASLTETASGILGFTASRAHNFHVLWFRGEQVQVVHWGGDPTKPVQVDARDSKLGPRKSFELWKEEVRGKSQAWVKAEVEAAVELRATLMSLLLSKEDSDLAKAAESV